MSGPAESGVAALAAIGRTVADLARTEAFYRDALGFGRIAPPEPIPPSILQALGLAGTAGRQLRMRLGRQTMAFLALDDPGAPEPAALATDPWFQHAALVVRDMGQAYRRLARFDPRPITRDGPQALPPASGGVTAYKFRDPDGHPLELIAFPEGDAARRWAGEPGLFLGIDHSAITVTDLDAGLAFFHDGLGLSVEARGLNRGPEQAALDGVEAPMVDVVGLKPAVLAVPHVELLHYRAPLRPGTPAPRVTPGDRATTWFVFTTPSLPGLMARLRRTHPDRSVTRSDDGRAAGVAGPDGHGVIVIEAAPAAE